MYLVMLLGVSLFFLIVGILSNNTWMIIGSSIGLIFGIVDAYFILRKK